MKTHKPLVLVILDGLAHNPNTRGNAVAAAKTPTLDRILKEYPSTELVTWGERVGLPEGQMGNSEVGHLNIGAGRVVEQELTRINRAVREKTLASVPALEDAFQIVNASPKSALHLIGLLSHGGVHSSLDHIVALAEAAVVSGVKRVFIHAITDGRDRPPKESLRELQQFESALDNIRQQHPEAEIGVVSIIGRYFAMDRDKRWERTEKAYSLFCSGKGQISSSVAAAISAQHQVGRTDEFLEPAVIELASDRSTRICDGDVILFCNFRADRMRQIVSTFLNDQPPFSGFEIPKPPVLGGVRTLTIYDESFSCPALFTPIVIKNHLGQVVGAHHLHQLRIAETEKYAHVTYFFNGGLEHKSPGEDWVLVPSPRDVATYDLKPQMSAFELTERLLLELGKNYYDLVVVNFANCDMVGHTGVFDAAVNAVETVDTCLGKILALLEGHASVLVTADHGNADQMIDYETGNPHTFHTTYPVPFVLVDTEYLGQSLRAGGALCDIAPTACKLLGLKQPSEMTGQSLL